MLRSLVAVTALFAANFTAIAQDAAQPEAQQIEGIVAIVNDDLISFTDVRQRARLLLLSLGGQQPTQEQIQQLTAQALEQLIDEKLQLQEASEYDVEVTDDDIADSIAGIAQQSGITREDLVSSLLQSGVNPNSLEDQSRADIAWRRIMRGLYGSRIRISKGQITGQLDRLKAAAEHEQYQLSEIFLYAPQPEDREQALTAAQSIKAQIEAGAPFQLAAERFSSAPTAATGGDMGWVTIDDLDELRGTAVQALDGPGLTEPIASNDGVYLLLVQGKRDPSEQTTMVDLTRITVVDGVEASLNTALETIGSCDEVAAAIEADSNLKAAVLSDVIVDELGAEGKTMVMATEIGDHTDIFAQSGTLAVMFVCAREDDVENLPSSQQIEDRLFSQQLGMISERSLRNLRRDATIIRR